MMNKFIITSIQEVKDEENPVLYKVIVGKNYYVHKGKKLADSVNRFLDDVYRGMRGKKCPDNYSKVVEYCNLHPQIYKVSVEVISNGSPDTILKKEKSMYKSMKNDEYSLNRLDLEPYLPEWMLTQSLQKRCENPIYEGIVNGKKIKFKFCPNCGRLNKLASS